MNGGGFLAIWSDIAPDLETDYLHWLTREHTAERVGIPGFLGVRVFRAMLANVNRFFILYELQGPEVVDSQAYLDRLNAPTPWSKRMMPNLGNFVRGGGRIVASSGTGQGGVVSALSLSAPLPQDCEALVLRMSQLDRIAAVRAFETDTAKTSVETEEKSIREKDHSFETLLLIEGLDEAAVTAAVSTFFATAERVFNNGADHGVLYKHCFALERRLLPSP